MTAKSLGDERLYLHHMLERCQRIGRLIAPGKLHFDESEGLQDGVIRNIEVIGEAAKHVSPATRALLPAVNWRAVCGMRDVLIHGYADVDIEEVWLVASNRVPDLLKVLEHFLSLDAPEPSHRPPY